MIRLSEENVYVLAPIEELQYFDSQSAQITSKVSPLEVWNTIVNHEQPLLKAAFWVRDQVSSLFGVKKIGGFRRGMTEKVREGEYLDFFLVEYVDDTTLVLTERDRHLDVMTCVSTDNNRVVITSSVKIHNWFGHAYMVPVGIAHKWIVRGMLKRLQNAY